MVSSIQAQAPTWPSALLGARGGQASVAVAAAPYAVDTYKAQATAQATADTSGGAIAWLGGAAAAGLLAIPRLARFGPVGFLLGAVVVLAGGFYGSRAVGAAKGLLQGEVRPAVEVGAWAAGGILVARAIASWRNPGALVAAGAIWLGSWAAGKAVDLLWPKTT